MMVDSAMQNYEHLFDQLRAVAEHYLPIEAGQAVLPVAVASLLIGMVLSFSGAKLLRILIVGVFIIGGGACGYALAQSFDFSEVVGIAIGAIAIGAMGFFSYRLWVGIGCAILFACIGLSIYGEQNVLPRFIEYGDMIKARQLGGAGEFNVPSPETQASYMDPDPEEFIEGFWSYLNNQDQSVRRNLLGIALGTGVLGLLLGLLATRFMLVVSTAAIGTIMTATGAVTLLVRLKPETKQVFTDYPQWAVAMFISYLIASVAVQMLTTRKVPLLPKAEPQKTEPA